MRRTWMLAGVAAMGLCGAAAAQDRDTPPPGCRWIGDDLGCRDGRGHYRRAGDGEIIGTYPISKPRPKPAPRPRPVIPTEAPPSTGDLPAGPTADAGAPAAQTPLALNDGGAAPATEAQAPEPTLAPPPPPPEATAAQAAPAKPKPWWQAVWDWLVGDIMNLLRRLGLAK
ncbi:MAG: hypothetical protein IT546_10320 [Caulobacteraceae bacterium]|nr:hypothetical protein [Caulobacteraceae bacterium]